MKLIIKTKQQIMNDRKILFYLDHNDYLELYDLQDYEKVMLQINDDNTIQIKNIWVA